MVSLPVSRQTNSSTKVRNCSSDSPVFKSARISTIIGTMTFIQPERIKERVPSKSKSTTRALRAETPGVIFSTMEFKLLLEFLDDRWSVVYGGSHDGAERPTHHARVPQKFALGQDREGRQDDGKLEKDFAKMEPERLSSAQV